MRNTIKKLATIVLLGILAFLTTACSQPYTVESFRDALIKADVGATIANIKISQKQVIYARDNLELNASLDICTDEYAALTWFQSFYKRFENCTFEGDSQSKFEKDFSYFTLNGETKDDQFSSIVGYYYGGWYCKKDTVIIVYTTLDTDKSRTEVDRILTQLKYPKPQVNTRDPKKESAQESIVQRTTQSESAGLTQNTKNETTQTTEVKLIDIMREGPLLKGTPYDIDGHFYGYSIGSDYEDATYIWKLDDKTISRLSGRQEFNKLILKLSIGVCSEPPIDKRQNKANCIYIFADGKLIYENTNITSKTKTQPMTFDITGCKELKIRFCSYTVTPAIFEPVLCPE